MSNAGIFPPRVLMVAKGATYGTVEAPVAANAIRTSETDVTEMTSERIERLQEDSQTGRINLPAITKLGVSISTTTDLAGSGVAGTAPGTGLLWRACGMNQTIQTGTSVTYAPVSLAGTTVLDWLDARCNHNGTDYLALGCRGTVTVTLAANQLGKCAWNLMGLYTEPTNVAIPTPAPANQALALPLDVANTPTFTLGGVSVCVNSFTFTQNNTMELVDAMGCGTKVVRLLDHQPEATITFYEQQLSAFNTFQKATSGAVEALQVIHGPAGNRVTFNVPRFGYGDTKSTDIGGIKGYTCPLYILHDPGLPNHYSWVFS